MNRLARHLSSSMPFLRPRPDMQPFPVAFPFGSAGGGAGLGGPCGVRGIRVDVRNGNLEQALSFMERKMRESGMERLIRRRVGHHLKNSEKRILARKNLEQRLRSEDLARKLRNILVKKIRGL